jgi:hypothetical protein
MHFIQLLAAASGWVVGKVSPMFISGIILGGLFFKYFEWYQYAINVAVNWFVYVYRAFVS